MAQNARTLFQLFSTSPMGKAPIVRGFRTSPPSTLTSPSDIRLNRMENLSQSRVNSPHNARSASPLQSVQRGSTQSLTPVATRAIPIKVQMPVNASWPRNPLRPGHVSERIAAFERLATAQSGTTSSRSSASVVRVEAQAQAPTTSTAKREAPKPPPAPAPAPMKTTASILQQTLKRSTSAPRQTDTPPLPPPARADASNPLDRSNSYPPTADHGKALFAELAKHPLVRSRATGESAGNASKVEPNSSIQERAPLPLKDRPLDQFQLALRDRIGDPAAPIKVTQEVQRQAEELREERQARLNAAMRNNLWKQAESNTIGSEESDANTLKRNLMTELNGVLATRSRKVQSG